MYIITVEVGICILFFNFKDWFGSNSKLIPSFNISEARPIFNKWLLSLLITAILRNFRCLIIALSRV